MNILLISQCKKNALKETRRIIDQFAERSGGRTWQTAITEEGLITLRNLLKRTARKNTAVACYWTRGKNNTELLWLVGDRSQFNDEGRVPTNRTKRNILRSDNENQWQYGSSIQIIATLSALLHDLGKATIGFQNKLKLGTLGDPYRHEWISLQLFMLMIEGCDSNESVLTRLATFEHYQQLNPDWHNKLISVNRDKLNLEKSPSLAQWIGWLIVSHHRMPMTDADERWDRRDNKYKEINSIKQQNTPDYIEDFTPQRFFKKLSAVANWVWNPKADQQNQQHFWQLAKSVTTSKLWLNQLKRWANKALNDFNLKQLAIADYINDPFLLHLSRLALMTGDHNFSSRPRECHIDNSELIANTASDKQAKQYLDEHLLGVAKYTARFARLLPVLDGNLPSLSKHKPFTERSKIQRFMWQNYAVDLTKSISEHANEAGFFGINMASTGCGKTLANSKIMYTLADAKRGIRFTIALGLRVLTLQTGKVLRQKLNLTDEQLAILVGGQANKALFELAQQDNDSCSGSESTENLIDGFVDVYSSAIDADEFGTIIQDHKARSLLLTPLVTCTIDHLIQASENQRGGKHIVPILRLLTADLILDEPDDFDQNDLPALARLVYLSGLFGSKVLLSSATLTPDLVSGLFAAYQAGRKIWQKQQNKPPLPIVCSWFDEFEQQATNIECDDDFNQAHQQFVTARINRLQQASIRRQGVVMPLADYQKNKPENTALDFPLLAQQLIKQAYQLHTEHHNVDPKTTKKISLGLIRLAHTENVIALARAIYQLTDMPTDTQLHIVVYHAKQLLLLRSKLEEKLDRLLSRNEPNALFMHPEIRQELDQSQVNHHLFIVIGTPVTEVGRDHDYDWAIIEPSSMRSIIQLVGRVWRHRPDKVANSPNVAILSSNLKAIKQGNSLGLNKICFYHPGFESDKFRLTTHKSSELITETQLSNINAISRITRPDVWHDKISTLAELEHRVMADLFNIPTDVKHKKRESNEVTSYWCQTLAHSYCVHLQLLTPFRRRARKQIEYVCQFNEDGQNGFRFSPAEIAWQTPNDFSSSKINEQISYQSWAQLFDSDKITPWLTADFHQELIALSHHFPDMPLPRLALQFATITLNDQPYWYYHPWFGFYRGG
ncbi:type I-F CRISPR-associated helicase Cas3f [Orbus sturtevantii]|uniref:type I-F CRISPR-associated helicase Cas3f n=1 Tax=Orbus sturtevantii TaxID=3074109 RepID=UPI00370D747C